MVSTVEAWTTDPLERSLVCKRGGEAAALRREAASLRWLRAHTDLPVPAVLGSANDGRDEYLLLERLPGRTLEGARISRQGRIPLQRELAAHLARLHAIHREDYGDPVDGEHVPRWLDWFAPRLRYNYDQTAHRLSCRARKTIEALLEHLSDRMPETGPPTLIHSDLWAANILVDDRDADRPRITGFIDPGVLYADVEYELAYLQVFQTANRHFFDAYSRIHPLRDGFARRCRVYWLNTLLLHLWLFGDDYLARCEALAERVV